MKLEIRSDLHHKIIFKKNGKICKCNYKTLATFYIFIKINEVWETGQKFLNWGEKWFPEALHQCVNC